MITSPLSSSSSPQPSSLSVWLIFFDYFHPCDTSIEPIPPNHNYTYASIERSLSMQFFSIQKEAIDAYVLCFNHYFQRLLPLLYQHMSSEGIVPEMYLMDWIMSLFTKVDDRCWCMDGWVDRGMEGWLSKVCIYIFINYHNHRNHNYYHQHHIIIIITIIINLIIIFIIIIINLIIILYRHYQLKSQHTYGIFIYMKVKDIYYAWH